MLVIAILYLVLLIPEPEPETPIFTKKIPFVWNRDSLWFSLESKFLQIRNSNFNLLSNEIDRSLLQTDKLLNKIEEKQLNPTAHEFTELENSFFNLASMISAYPQKLEEYINIYSRMRFIVKNQSLQWDINNIETRRIIYRLLYGGRAAIEEIMIQAPSNLTPSNVMGCQEPSITPNANILGVTIHSGDILVSRGGAPTSALIARGNDYPGNFSHIALTYVDPKTHLISIIESHIERGVVISSLEEYLKDTKLRVMVLRLRSDLPQMIKDPMLPHKAAEYALNEVKSRHIPYDFEMDYKDHSKQFCSEVAFVPYKKMGIQFWKGISNISSIGIVKWLSLFGVKNFETHEPSDLEYDPQLRVVTEWRDPETLYKDHLDNAVIEGMLERANVGKGLDYSFYMLPLARIAKLYSFILNQFGMVGPIPEGMSAATGLRNKQLTEDHNSIKKIVEAKAKAFKEKNNYTPPYWRLVAFSSEAIKEIKY